MSIGDINSNERGTGARFNDGKPPMELIPAHIFVVWEKMHSDRRSWVEVLAEWQQRRTSAAEMLAFFNEHDMREAARVFGFGAQKYAAWNWTKGMPWSVPAGCALRHQLRIWEGETLDDESGLAHRGHLLCNIIMLVHYETYFREGDDRPPAYVFGAKDEQDAKALPRYFIEDCGIEWQECSATEATHVWVLEENAYGTNLAPGPYRIHKHEADGTAWTNNAGIDKLNFCWWPRPDAMDGYTFVKECS